MNHIATAFLLLLALALPAHPADLIFKDAPAQVYFSSKGDWQDAIVSTIGKAKSTPLVQAYISLCLLSLAHIN